MKISVITINYNNAEGLRRTINSVVTQDVNNYEFIIIDGGSTDGSLDIIKEYSQYISYYVSEPDRGIYHALNKGTAKATGDYCIYMNSGDEFYSKTVIKDFIASKPTADFEVGGTCFLQPDGSQNLYYPQPLTTYFILNENYNHQSMFIKTTIARRYPYSEEYKISADYNLFVNALVKDGSSFHLLDFIVAKYEMMGLSSQNVEKRENEKKKIVEQLNLPQLTLREYAEVPYQWINLINRMRECGRFGSLLFQIDNVLIRLFKFFRRRK